MARAFGNRFHLMPVVLQLRLESRRRGGHRRNRRPVERLVVIDLLLCVVDGDAELPVGSSDWLALRHPFRECHQLRRLIPKTGLEG
jgi:hypothetical protein